MKKYFIQNVLVGVLCLFGIYLFFNDILGSPMRVTTCALITGFMGLFMQLLTLLDDNYVNKNKNINN